MTTNKRALPTIFLYVLFILFSTLQVADGTEIPAELSRKITFYNKMLAEWARNPVIVQAVLDSNTFAHSAYPQSVWEAFFEDDPQLTPYVRTPTAALLISWETPDIAKLFVRDKNGNIVAGTTKPKFFNIADRLPFKNAIKGSAWADDAIHRDPLLPYNCIQISAPIKDEKGFTIGVIHSAVIAR